MAYTLHGSPFSAVLHALRDQSRCYRSLSFRFASHEGLLPHSLSCSQPASRLRAPVTAVRQHSTEQLVASDFFAARATFEQLGYDSDVCQAIRAAGLDRPSRVQVMPPDCCESSPLSGPLPHLFCCTCESVSVVASC